MVVYPLSSFNFVELEATIKVVLAEVESKGSSKTDLLECVMCTKVGSWQDLQGILSDILVLASSDPNVLVEPMSPDANNNIGATKPLIGILMQLHLNDVAMERQLPTPEGSSKHAECQKVEET